MSLIVNTGRLALALSLICCSSLANDSVLRPTQHFTIESPASLTPNEARAVYQQIKDRMIAAYRLSRHPVSDQYFRWRRFNTAPYLSATHGNRYVNNYTNVNGRIYGLYENAGEMPVNAIIVKEAFTVTSDGGVFTGPLSIMEKMEPGFNPEHGDWRYTEIMPDGSILGETKAENAQAVGFCATCHDAAPRGNDKLYFIPRQFRRESLLELD